MPRNFDLIINCSISSLQISFGSYWCLFIGGLNRNTSSTVEDSSLYTKELTKYLVEKREGNKLMWEFGVMLVNNIKVNLKNKSQV